MPILGVLGIYQWSTLSGLMLHGPSARLYWTAQGASGGYEVRRAFLDGSVEEVVLADVPPQTRAHAATLSADGLLSSVYIGVAQPGNASLLLQVEAKEHVTDVAPSSTTLVTLLRDVAPATRTVAAMARVHAPSATRAAAPPVALLAGRWGTRGASSIMAELLD